MLESVASVNLSTKLFQQISSFIYKECGINLPSPKKVLVESRLRKRLSFLNLTSFEAYFDFVMSPAGAKQELVHMIDAIATNKTDFFREPMHFQFMAEHILPEYAASHSRTPFKVWSSACSSGEEPYTIAMTMEEYGLKHKIDYKITATDISTKILNKALKAIYTEKDVEDIPLEIKKRYLLKSKDRINRTVRIVPALRSKVGFKRLNLIDGTLDVDHDYDLIFCRNVLIYFDRPTQQKVVSKLLSHLKAGGYLFIGHSESIYHMNLPVSQKRPTIFQKK